MSALSTTARHEYYVELGNGLPPPVDPTHEYRMRRLTTAVETFNALRPGDAYEARLAVQIVLAGAHAADSLRLAGLYRDDFSKMMRCRAQAAGMMREVRAASRMLAQEQKVRLAAEAVAGTAAEHPAAPSAPLPEPQATPAPAKATAPQPAPAPAGAPSRPAAAQAAPPSPEAIAQAEAFMQQHSVAAAQIRHDGGVTPQNRAYYRHVPFPSDPAVIDALVSGTSDLLSVLDDVGGEDLEDAA
jgi:hypothetical protein